MVNERKFNLDYPVRPTSRYLTRNYEKFSKCNDIDVKSESLLHEFGRCTDRAAEKIVGFQFPHLTALGTLFSQH